MSLLCDFVEEKKFEGQFRDFGWQLGVGTLSMPPYTTIAKSTFFEFICCEKRTKVYSLGKDKGPKWLLGKR